MGSGELGCPALERLLGPGRDEVVGLVTQPDRPKGRNLQVAPCAAKAVADARGRPVLTPTAVNDPAVRQTLRDLRPDVIVVAAYGQKLGAELLALPTRGCINIHASLLPKYRGAAPIQWAIANGDSVTGITIMHMSEQMDAGDIIARTEVPIRPDDTGGTLYARLAKAASGALADVLDAIAEGRATRTPQDESAATPAPKLRKCDGRIDWTLPAGHIVNRVRGFNPWPCCFCVAGDPAARLRVLTAAPADGVGGAGTVLATDGDGPVVAAGEGAVRLLEVQPEGRKVMSGADYQRGYGVAVGAKVE